MNQYKVEELEDGMLFNEPVYIDEESLLVPEGVAIRGKDIERLLRWGIETVESEGAPMQPSEEEGLLEADDSRQGDLLMDIYSKSVALMDTFFCEAEAGRSLPGDLLDTMMQDYYPVIRDSVDNAMGLTFRQMETGSRYAASAVNCMILSVAIGQRVKMPGHRLINLAQGALLHDIGMTRIPRAILEKRTALNQEELKAMQSHTVHSYRIICKELGLSEEVGRTVLLHHERWDGKGYPKGFSGKEIPVSARIVSVADAYEAMIRDRPYRTSMIGYRAVRQVLNDNGRRFDSDILKIFLKSMGVYPPGSIVILQDGSVGKVIKNHRDVPLRPVVQILVSKHGEKLSAGKRKEIDLLETSDAFIARAVHPKEIE